MSAAQDWHPGTGDGHRSRANTTGGKSQRGHKGRPNFPSEPHYAGARDVLRDERELERDRLAQQYEDEDAGRHYTSSDGSDPQSIEGRS